MTAPKKPRVRRVTPRDENAVNRPVVAPDGDVSQNDTDADVFVQWADENRERRRLQGELDAERAAHDAERAAHEATRRERDTWHRAAWIALTVAAIATAALVITMRPAPRAPRLSPETHYGASP